jgi:hypothetical protein
MIALESAAPFLVETHGTERARGKAHPATDTTICFDHDPFGFVSVDGFHRAGSQTGRFGTLKADDGKVESLRARIRHDAYAAKSRVAQACSLERTGGFTLPAAIAFEGIQNN